MSSLAPSQSAAADAISRVTDAITLEPRLNCSRALRRHLDDGAPRGQAMVEFALVAGLLALLLVVAVDFGRVFFGWVGVHNSSRVAANFAGTHPDADWTNSSDPDVVDYVRMVQNDAAG